MGSGSGINVASGNRSGFVFMLDLGPESMVGSGLSSLAGLAEGGLGSGSEVGLALSSTV